MLPLFILYFLSPSLTFLPKIPSFYCFTHSHFGSLPHLSSPFVLSFLFLYRALFSSSSAQALCLSDEPRAVKEYPYPEKLPGELYDADTQCKWQFGEKAKLCTLDFKKVKLILDQSFKCKYPVPGFSHTTPIGSCLISAKETSEGSCFLGKREKRNRERDAENEVEEKRKN